MGSGLRKCNSTIWQKEGKKMPSASYVPHCTGMCCSVRFSILENVCVAGKSVRVSLSTRMYSLLLVCVPSMKPRVALRHCTT